jgi:hypothetical protein
MHVFSDELSSLNLITEQLIVSAFSYIRHRVHSRVPQYMTLLEYIVNNKNHRIVMITPNFSEVECLNIHDNSLNRMNNPVDISFDTTGNTYSQCY